MDVDEDTPDIEALKKEYDVQSLPTLVAVGPGPQDSTRIEGYRGKERTIKSLRAAIKKKKGSTLTHSPPRSDEHDETENALRGDGPARSDGYPWISLDGMSISFGRVQSRNLISCFRRSLAR